MTQEQKSQLYSNLLLQHTRLDNQINEIKAENFEMNDEQMGRIRVLQSKQGQLVGQMQQLMQG
ncbi:hypothetical protein UFOVP117_282 [uncultured Caudovirales phage]|jgi:hypothetical protein|uniref:Uncharacterized protein n=1 Tax=uncultured Caudovirales phage TaxID=2100421 RepID=A0A6J5L6Y3_9CAUD|nr:hypothetical protein UFOVP117_282 [uncultured Caudovirales phage]